MLPRPRLVCQEPGLRPIGRSPGVPDKSSRGLGSMSRYSAQNLICFIAFPIVFIHLWLCLGTLQDCHHAQCPLPLSIVIKMRLDIRQSKLPACLAEVQLAHEHSLAFMQQDWWNWQIKWRKSVSVGSYQYKNQVNGEFFAYLWVILLYFSLESRLSLALLELGQVVLKIWLGQEFTAVKLEFESLFRAIRHENVEIWKWNVDFRSKLHILCSQCS